MLLVSRSELDGQGKPYPILHMEKGSVWETQNIVRLSK